MKNILRVIIAAACAWTALWILFLPFLDNYFIADDFWHLAFARFSVDPWSVFSRPFFGDVFWRPLTIASEVWTGFYMGDQPGDYHLIDLCLHALNVLLVMLLIQTLLRDSIESANRRAVAAGAGGLMFALHPIAALTTAWFCCRADLLGSAGYLLTIILIARAAGKRHYLNLLAIIPALCSMLSKETMITLPVMAFATGVIFANAEIAGFRRRLMRGFWISLPVTLTTLVYLAWRFKVLGGLGGYEPIEPRLSFILPRLAYHLPELLRLVPRDLLFHHFPPETSLGILLPIFIVGIFLIGLAPALGSAARPFFLGLLWLPVSLLPLWNVSHMLVYREERLLYLPLVGLAVMLGCLVAAPRRLSLRVTVILMLVGLCGVYGLVSRERLVDWRAQAEQNRELVQALKFETEKLDPAKGFRRIYVVGLGPEHYYLDPMVKVELPLELLNLQFMLAEHDSLVWEINNFSGQEKQEMAKRGVAEAQPQVTRFFTDSGNDLLQITPPDMLGVAGQDTQALIWEWKDGRIRNIGRDLKRLYLHRSHLLYRYRVRPNFLPSWSFNHSAAEIGWELSEGVSINDQVPAGSAYGFTAQGNDPYLVSGALKFPTLGTYALVIRMRHESRGYLPPAQSGADLFWQTADAESWSDSRQISFPIIADGLFHTYRIQLSRNLAWSRSKNIRKLRFDPQSYAGKFWIASIEFESEPDK